MTFFFTSRLDRAPEDVVSHLPTRVWSGKGWEKESDWLKRLRTRALEGQSEGQVLAASPDKPRFDLERQLNSAANASETDIDEAEDGRKASSAHLLSAVHVDAPQPVETAASTEDDVLPGQDQPWFEGQVECVGRLAAASVCPIVSQIFFGRRFAYRRLIPETKSGSCLVDTFSTSKRWMDG